MFYENFGNDEIFGEEYLEAKTRADELLSDLIDLNIEQAKKENKDIGIYKVEDVVVPAAEEDENFFEKAGDFIEEKIEDVKEALKNQAEFVKDTIEDIFDKDDDEKEISEMNIVYNTEASEAEDDQNFFERAGDFIEEKIENVKETLKNQAEYIKDTVEDFFDGDNEKTEIAETSQDSIEFVEPEYGWTKGDFSSTERVDEAISFYHTKWLDAIERDDVVDIENCKRNIDQLYYIRDELAYDENLAFQAKLDRDLERYEQTLKMFEVDPPKY